jgi:serine/threonine protein kinase
MLINGDGHVKLTDFGLSRIGFIDDKSKLSLFIFIIFLFLLLGIIFTSHKGNTDREAEDEDLLMAYYNNRRSMRLSAEDVNSLNNSGYSSISNSASTSATNLDAFRQTPPSAPGSVSTSCSDLPAAPNPLNRSTSGGRIGSLRASAGSPSTATLDNAAAAAAAAHADLARSSTPTEQHPPFDPSNNNIPNGEGGGSKTSSNNSINFRKSPIPTRTKRANSTKKVVGTPDYLSPEILLGTGHGTYNANILKFLYIYF